MTHFADMTGCDYLPCSEDLPFVAVGWLEPEHAFSQGPVSEHFFERLCSLLHNPWAPPFVMCGVHACGFCRFSGGGGAVYRQHRIRAVSGGNLFIPHNGRLFVSPLNVAHYVDAHGYCPPEEFQHAVLAYPEMRSITYLRALLDCGGREWLRRLGDRSTGAFSSL